MQIDTWSFLPPRNTKRNQHTQWAWFVPVNKRERERIYTQYVLLKRDYRWFGSAKRAEEHLFRETSQLSWAWESWELVSRCRHIAPRKRNCELTNFLSPLVGKKDGGRPLTMSVSWSWPFCGNHSTIVYNAYYQLPVRKIKRVSRTNHSFVSATNHSTTSGTFWWVINSLRRTTTKTIIAFQQISERERLETWLTCFISKFEVEVINRRGKWAFELTRHMRMISGFLQTRMRRHLTAAGNGICATRENVCWSVQTHGSHVAPIGDTAGPASLLATKPNP